MYTSKEYSNFCINVNIKRVSEIPAHHLTSSHVYTLKPYTPALANFDAAPRAGVSQQRVCVCVCVCECVRVGAATRTVHRLAQIPPLRHMMRRAEEGRGREREGREGEEGSRRESE